MTECIVFISALIIVAIIIINLFLLVGASEKDNEKIFSYTESPILVFDDDFKLRMHLVFGELHREDNNTYRLFDVVERKYVADILTSGWYVIGLGVNKDARKVLQIFYTHHLELKEIPEQILESIKKYEI